MATRTLCLRCSDWPVVAVRARDPTLTGRPVVVLGHGRVVAASREARAEGVRVGLRRREAETCCPGVAVVDADPAADGRAFEPVARACETLAPRLVLERPGVLTFPTRGPSRYFGGDEHLAERVVDVARGAGVPDARVGIADSVFGARLAARRGVVVPPAGTPAFLAPWPVAVLGDAELADLLDRLGLRTLGALAELSPGAVLARFGPGGIAAHRLARGDDTHPPALTVPPPDLVETLELDPPAQRLDTAAFASKTLADRLLAALEDRGLVCTRVVVEAETEHGEHLARAWRHEGALTAHALAERVRWQLEGWVTVTGGLTGGLTRLRLVPDEVLPARGRQLGFWGGDAAAAERASRVLARLQGMLGPDAVVTVLPQGGRTPLERVRLVPWGEPREPEPGRPLEPVAGPVRVERPAWPGAIPGPAPARVFSPPLDARLLDHHGDPVVVSARGEASGPPTELRCAALPGGGGRVAAWSGPWAQDVRWWDPRARSRRACWQLVVGDVACLVHVARGRAALDAIYD